MCHFQWGITKRRTKLTRFCVLKDLSANISSDLEQYLWIIDCFGVHLKESCREGAEIYFYANSNSQLSTCTTRSCTALGGLEVLLGLSPDLKLTQALALAVKKIIISQVMLGVN